MKPICSKIIRTDKRGRITIPKAIREIYGLPEKVTFEIRLLSNHTIELIPEAPYREIFLEKMKLSKAKGDG